MKFSRFTLPLLRRSLGRMFTSTAPEHSKKHSSGVGLPLLAVTMNIKKHFLAHLIPFFNVQRDIFNKCHKLQPGH